ncbi:MAG: hypothetical protein ABL958_15205 [Bdellovibrionia bacterium]
MRIAASIFFIVSIAVAKPTDVGIQSEWRFCAVHADCVVLDGVCGGWDTANVKFKEEANAAVAKVAADVRCKAPSAPNSPPVAVCENKTCRISLK